MAKVDVFISFTGEDRAWAEWIAWQLEAAGTTTRLQAWDFRPGAEFVHEMEQALRQAERVVAVLSPAYVSQSAQAEWLPVFARDPSGEAGLLVPVRVAPLDSLGLLRIRVYVDLVGLTEHEAAERLMSAVRHSKRPSRPKNAPPFPGAGPTASAGRTVSPPFPGSEPSIASLAPGAYDWPESGRDLTIDIVEGDVLAFTADVVAFKYAQESFGADRHAARALTEVGVRREDLQPGVWDYRLVDSGSALEARQVLFIGVPALVEFRYGQIRDFGNLVIRIVSERVPDCRHLAMTLHGPGYGLDEVEALLSMLAGCIEAAARVAPPNLERISVVERDAARVGRLRRALKRTSRATDEHSVRQTHDGWLVRLGEVGPLLPGAGPHERSPFPGTKGEYKPRIFVAMPFAAEFSDLFEYGIQRPVRDLGFLCERVDQDVFTGDILERVKSQIEASSAIVAVLTGANPNVYLEVGYAWGKDRPTILLTDDEEEPRFDVRGQRCLRYRRIRDVEEALTRELRGLKDQGQI